MTFYTKYGCIILGNVCGGHCLSEGQDCQCGQETITFNETTCPKSYCCSESTCSIENGIITCKEGNIKNLNDRCNNACPFLKSLVTNKMAISTTDCNLEEKYCFELSGSFNKICTNGSSDLDASSSFQNFCGVRDGFICRPATYNKIIFEQCYIVER